MPPAALTSSAAIMMPLCVDWPKVGCGPVIDPSSPTRMSPPPAALLLVPAPSFGGQPSSPNDNTASEIKMIAFFRIALLFKELRIVHERGRRSIRGDETFRPVVLAQLVLVDEEAFRSVD